MTPSISFSRPVTGASLLSEGGAGRVRPDSSGIGEPLGGACPTGRRPRELLDLLAHGLEADPERLQRLGADTLPLGDQTEEDVLRPDVVVVEEPRLFLSQNHDSASPIRDFFKNIGRPPDSTPFPHWPLSF